MTGVQTCALPIYTVTAKDLDLATLRAMVADRAKPVNVIDVDYKEIEN